MLLEVLFLLWIFFGMVNTFVVLLSRIIGHVVDRVILKNNQGYGIAYIVTVLISQVILSILASTIVMYFVMYFSRKREFIADTGGADLAGHQKKNYYDKLRVSRKEAFISSRDWRRMRGSLGLAGGSPFSIDTKLLLLTSY